MKIRTALLNLSPFALSLLAPAAQAGYACTTASTPLTVIYDGNQLDRTGQITVSCSRAPGDPAKPSYSVGFREDTGRKYKGIGGDASAADTLNYDIFQDSSYTTKWNLTGSGRLLGTIDFGTASSTSFTLPYYLRIPLQLNKPAGTYAAELQEVTIQIPRTVTPPVGSNNIQLYAIISPVCASLTPSNMTLNYVAFSTNAVSVNNNFWVLCSNKLPYTMSLSANTGTLAGIAYTLSLSSTNVVATGAQQDHIVRATAAAGQAGICTMGTCSETSPPITFTISY